MVLYSSSPAISISQAARPPFPIRYLKGTPVFWDDFETGPGGFLLPERALANQLNTGGQRSLSGGPWGFRDGNEYGVYITADASARGRRSLFTGGDPTSQTYGDVGNQDVHVDAVVPSGIVGVEFSLLCKAGVNPAGHLLSIEDKDPADSTRFRELQMQISPWSPGGATPNGAIFSLLSDGTTVEISGPGGAQDDLGQNLTGITGPFSGQGTSLSRGTTVAWHRVAFVVDLTRGRSICMFFDKFRRTTLYHGSGLWKISSPDGTINALKEGIRRIEFHSLTNGTAFAPEFYHDDVVVTDEANSVYP